ncbi:hypothetical protein VKT23_007919 [Stygiomarasmius scandens]|uniref:BTB domain-containing protein n=1 Tax=Marasmiellus scandens TaxID=2682957 RepID=A0ABR1JIS2_9AGAR
MFALPSGQRNAEGSSDANPIRLEGIKAKEFRYLLKVLYPPVNARSVSATSEEWKVILKLATFWRFLEIRALAIENLTSCGSMRTREKIVLGRKYFVAEWVKSGYHDLIKRNEMPTVEDFDMIGYATGIRIFRVREELKKVAQESFKLYSYNRVCFNCNTQDQSYNFCQGCMEKWMDRPGNIPKVESAINKEFHAELEDIARENTS